MPSAYWPRSLCRAVVLLGLASLGAAPEQPWPLRPVTRPDVPTAPKPSWARNPIDRFIAAKLAREGLAPAPEADRVTLIRRLSFDLIGLPPTPEEVDAFVRDDQPDAYARLVDRLLDSPRYGERWGRHWLDLVRFAETHGYERDDPKPNAWRYRDWVIGAFNRDLPYDRFLTEQLAGDELPDADDRTKTATGMYRLGLIDDEPADALMDRFDQLDDIVKTVGTTFLGMSIHCARCHDHKFDPIKQTDYYRMLALFAPGQRFVRDDLESISIILATPEERAQNAAFKREQAARLADLKARSLGLREVCRQRLMGLALARALIAPGPAETAGARAGAAALPLLAKKLEEFEPLLSAVEKMKRQGIEARIALEVKTKPPPLAMVLGLTDTGPKAEPTHLLSRGDAHKPGAEVAPGFPAILAPEPPTIVPPPGGKTTGRRLALARWLARGEHPLTARVMVNRLWQHHFGQGIVATPSDFGAMGEEPSHPALLDWLAAEFVARGWSLKAMHRLMVTSATYRQSGAWNSQAAALDPNDAWLWRMAPRRLEAEPIRDAVLAVSGALNAESGGPSVMPPIDPVVLAGQSRPGSGWKTSKPRDAAKRSIYVYVKRTLPLPELEVLDAADNADPCPSRAVTTTAPQALALLNSAFYHDEAAHFAARLEREAGSDPSAQVARAFRLALSRLPTDAERRDALDFLARQAERIARRARPEDRADGRREALRAFALVLLNTNEFVTID